MSSPVPIRDSNDPFAVLLREASALTSDAAPAFLGRLETIRCTALARLSAPAPVPVVDKLIGIDEACAHLDMKRTFVYQNANRLGGRKVGGRIKFSTKAIDKFLKAQLESYRDKFLEKGK